MCPSVVPEMKRSAVPRMIKHTSKFDPIFHWWDSHSFRYFQGQLKSPSLFAILLGCWLTTSMLPIANAAKRSTYKMDPVQACWNGFKPGQWDELDQCLSNALAKLEGTLKNALVVEHKKAAESRDTSAAVKTLSDSNAQWLKFRDVECERRQTIVAGRNHPGVGETTCQIRMIQGRLQDFKFDNE
ncbi:MAG: lysozyme inhibitor LprI family protein [Aquabacterium sp.]|nr:lysozyme inhibitor LprI family protein [Aquabacterium sp.]